MVFYLFSQDPNNNKIKVFPRQTAGPFGVIEGELGLSEQPMFGEWSIHVTAEASVLSPLSSKIAANNIVDWAFRG